MTLAAALDAIVAALAAIPPAEWVAVLLAFGYLLLAVRQNAWCWACAIASSAIFLGQRRPAGAAALDRRLALVLELAAQARAEALPLRALALGGDWQAPADEAALQQAVASCPPARETRLPAAAPDADLLCLLVCEDAGPALLARLAAWRAAGLVVLAFRLAGRGGRPLPPGPGNHELAP